MAAFNFLTVLDPAFNKFFIVEYDKNFRNFVKESLEGFNYLGRFAQLRRIRAALPDGTDPRCIRHLDWARHENRRAIRAYNTHKSFKNFEHQRRQAYWFEEGGRQKAYYKKHRYGQLTHNWIISKIQQKTGMEVDTLPDIENWDEEESPQFVHQTSMYIPRRCREKNYDFSKMPFKGLKPEPRKFRNSQLLILLQQKIFLLREKRSAKTLLERPSNILTGSWSSLVAANAKYFKDCALNWFNDFLQSVQEKKRVKRVGKAWAKLNLTFNYAISTADHQAPIIEAHGDDECESFDQASNVVLEKQTGESQALPIPTPLDTKQLASTDLNPQYDSLLDRWLFVDTFTWDTSKTQGESLWSKNIPIDIIRSRSNTPNIQFFKLFQYWQGDMEIKIQCNANQFQVGQLQASFRYMEYESGVTKFYESVSSRSQTDHCLISANDNNAAMLYIPYKHIYPMIPTTIRDDSKNTSNIGALTIKVLNRLYATSNSYHSVDVSIWIRFLNGTFSGMKNRDLGQDAPPKFGENQGWLDNLRQVNLNFGMKFDNADKPTQTTSNKVIPQAIDSICSGTGMAEHQNVLRMDPTTQNQNLQMIGNDMHIKNQVRIYGFVKTIEWLSENPTGTILTRIDASPMFNLDEYNSTVIENDIAYDIPPVGVISEMFAWWRGSLELRLDIIATDFHRGKLMICYIPRYLSDVSYEQAIGSPHVVFDLRESKQFSFIVPWITNQHYWPRRFGDRTQGRDPPGRVHIFVQNKLVPMDNVRDRVDINLYWRAGEDFEVNVMAQPSLSVPWYPLKITSPTQIIAFPAMRPYSGLVINVAMTTSTKFYGVVVAAYDATHSAFTKFLNLKTDGTEYYKYKGKDSIIGTLRATPTTTAEFKYGIGLQTLQGKILCIVPKESIAQDIVGKLREFLVNPTEVNNPLKALEDWDLDSYDFTWPGAAIKENTAWDLVAVKIIGEHQAGEKDSVSTTPINPIPSTTPNGNILGENITDLKDICRRYNYYTTLLDVSADNQLSEVDILLPVNPYGLALPVITNDFPFLKFVREGHIPLVASGFRFFRGGLRFKVISDNNQLVFTVCHYPDMKIEKTYKPDKESKYLHYSYAAYIQPCAINNIISFEIPYYVPGDNLFANPLKSISEDAVIGLQDCYNLGTMAISCSSTQMSSYFKVAKANIVILYSLSDDSTFHTFQGYPSLILRTQRVESAEHQGFLDFVHVLSGNKSIKVDVGLTDLLGTPECKSLEDSLRSFGCNVTQQILCELVHIFLNPTPKTIVWSLLALLINLKIFELSRYSELLPTFTRLIELFKVKLHLTDKPDNLNGETSDSAEHQSDTDYQDISIVLAGILNAIVISLNIKEFSESKKPKSMGKYIATLCGGLASSGLRYTSLVTFFSNMLKVVKQFYLYIMYWKNQDTMLEKLIEDDLPLLRDWVSEAIRLTDVVNEDKIFTQGSIWANHLEMNYLIGTRIYQCFQSYTGQKIDKNLFQSFLYLYREIVKKRDSMHKRGVSAVSRKDPYCLYFAGEGGVGKSNLASTITTRLIQEVNIPYKGEPVYTLPSGAKYWNGCRNQPIILIDDFLVVNTGTLQEEAIRAFFEIKGPAILNPPMAHLEDKELRYVPELMVVCSNHFFPNVNHVDKTAFYRRRDLLVEVTLCHKLRNAGITRINELTTKQLKEDYNIDTRKYEHLRFKIAGDPCGGKNFSKEGAAFLTSYTYEEFYQQLLERFIEYRENQDAMFRERLIQYERHLDDDLDEVAMLTEKQAEYKRVLANLQVMRPKENCSMQEYFKLVFMAARGDFVDDLKTRSLIEVSRAAIENNRREIAQQNNDEPDHQAPSVSKFGSARSPLTFTAVFVQAELNLSYFKQLKLFDKIVDVIRKPQYTFELIMVINSTNTVNSVSRIISSMDVERFKLKVSPTIIRWYLFEHFPEVQLSTYFIKSKKDNSQGLPVYMLFLTQLYSGASAASKIKYSIGYSVTKDQMQLQLSRYFQCMLDESRNPKYTVKTEDQIISFLENLPQNTRIVDQLKELLLRPTEFDITNSYYWRLANKMYALKLYVKDKNPETFNQTVSLLNYGYKYKNRDEYTALSTLVTEALLLVLSRQEGWLDYLLGETDALSNPEIFEELSKIDEALGDILSLDVLQSPFLEKLESKSTGGYCDHCRFSPSMDYFWKAEKPEHGYWQTFSYSLYKDKHHLLTDRCPDYKGSCTGLCCWADAEYYELCMRVFDQNNPSQKRLIKSMPDEQQPYYMRRNYKFDFTFLDKIRNLCLDGGDWLSRNCIGPFKTILVLSATVAVLYQFYSLYKIFTNFNGSGGNPNIGGHHSAYEKNAKAPQKTVMKSLARFVKHSSNNTNHGNHNIDHQMGMELANNISNQIAHNTFFMVAPGDTKMFRILALGGTSFIYLKHYHEYFLNHNIDLLDIIRYNDPNYKVKVRLSDCNIYLLPERSVGVIELPRHIQPVRRLYNKFRREDQAHLSLSNCTFLEITLDEKIFRPVKPTVESRLYISGTDVFSEQELFDVLKYEHGEFGNCGTPIIDNVRGTILGIHVAGKNGKGYAEQIYKETFESLFCDPPVESVDLFDKVNDQANPPAFEGNFTFIGRVENGLGHHQSPDTQIQPSLLSGIFPIATAPAPLGTRDPRVPLENYSPLRSGVENMLQPNIDFPNYLFEPAREDIKNEIMTKCNPIRTTVGPLSYAEVIQGIPGLQYYDGIDMTTSEGYPMSRSRPPGKSNKSWLFRLDNEDFTKPIGINPNLLNLMEHDMQNRFHGKMNMILHDDCLKDARIPIEKIHIPGKTRVFSVSPVQFTIQFKQFFGDFLASFKQSRLKLEHAVGINTNGTEWGQLVGFLSKNKATKFVTGDYSNFGPTLNSRCVEAAFDIIIEWYEYHESKSMSQEQVKLYRRIRETMKMELIFALHLAGNVVYQVLCGLPSGNPATVELNCIVNWFYVRCAWLAIMSNDFMEGKFKMFLDHYYIHCKTLVYGDDIIIGVSDTVKDTFNSISLNQFFATYGIKYTDTQKGNMIIPYRDLQESTFLKRSFIPHPKYAGEWLANLEERFLLDIPNWCHSFLSLEEGTKSSAVACLAEAYGWGPKKFDEIKSKLLTHLNEKQIKVEFRSWLQWDMIHFKEYYKSYIIADTTSGDKQGGANGFLVF